MTLEQKIQNEISLAMKAKDEVRLGALRSVKAAILNEKVSGTDVVIDGVKHFKLKYDENNPFTDNDTIAVIQKLSKQRQEAFEIYSQAGKPELAEKERSERLVLEEFVPKQLTEDEVKVKVQEIIAETGASSMKDMGKVMGLATQRMKGVADGKTISTIVRTLLA